MYALYRVFIKYCDFFRIIKNIPDSGLSLFFPLCQCVYTHQAGRTPALQQNWQSLEKSQSSKEKTQYLMNSLTCFNLESQTTGWVGGHVPGGVCREAPICTRKDIAIIPFTLIQNAILPLILIHLFIFLLCIIHHFIFLLCISIDISSWY